MELITKKSYLKMKDKTSKIEQTLDKSLSLMKCRCFAVAHRLFVQG